MKDYSDLNSTLGLQGSHQTKAFMPQTLLTVMDDDVAVSSLWNSDENIFANVRWSSFNLSWFDFQSSFSLSHHRSSCSSKLNICCSSHCFHSLNSKNSQSSLTGLSFPRKIKSPSFSMCSLIQVFNTDLKHLVFGSSVKKYFGRLSAYLRTLIRHDFRHSLVIFPICSWFNWIKSFFSENIFSGFFVHMVLKNSLNDNSTAVCGMVSQFNSW